MFLTDSDREQMCWTKKLVYLLRSHYVICTQSECNQQSRSPGDGYVSLQVAPWLLLNSCAGILVCIICFVSLP